MLLPATLLITAASAEPVFSMERGLYTAAFALQVTPGASGTILYSLDGSLPETPLVGDLSIETTTLVSVREVFKDGTATPTVTHTFLFPLDAMQDPVMDAGIVDDPVYGPIIEETLWALPTISLVTESELTTIEQAVSVEWMDPEGETIQARCGARDVGGHSLNYDKNNIRLSFRSEYGTPKLKLDLYTDFASGLPPAGSHDTLNLRSGSHDSVLYLGEAGQYARNRWMDEAQLEMGHIVPHGRYGHLYVNGEYTGLYHVRERFDSSFMAEYLGGDEDDYEAINGGRTVDGSGSAWAAVVAASGSYQDFSALVDVDNYLDYMILNFYAGNDWDWNPDQNWMAAGPAQGTDGVGRFRFHSSDSDICLYYDSTINILHEVGPSYTFENLVGQWSPDFQVRLADRIYALLQADGVLSPAHNIARYEAITAQIESAVVAESARWGAGWWDRDDEWVTERQRLLVDYFPARSAVLLQQFQDAGWYQLGAPEISLPAGFIEANEVVTVSVPEDLTAALWVTLDGADPRRSGGAPSDTAVQYEFEAALALAHTTRLKARLRLDTVWGPLLERLYEVDAPAPLVLNEWNTVAEDGWLKDDGTDTTLGQIIGNGGDWIELLVLEDDLDIRGWRLELTDRSGEVVTLELTDDVLLSSLAAGTLFTVAAAMPEDAAYDPDGGDWRFHLQASATASGQYISATDFTVNHREWTLTILDADGRIRAGATGEGVSPTDGLSSSEVGLLAATPDDTLRRTSSDYTDSNLSSFGAANVWSDGEQDLSYLRRGEPTVTDIEDTAEPTDTPGLLSGPHPPDSLDASSPTPSDRGCSTSGSSGGLIVLGIVLLALRRRRAVPLLLAACQPVTEDVPEAPGTFEPIVHSQTTADTSTDTALPDDCDEDPAIHPDAPEVCDGIDNDCDGAIDDEDDDLVDGLPFFADEDGDGFGDAPLTACTAEGHALIDGDCDDTDASIHPDAVELCDGLDRNCSGSGDDAVGLYEDCPAQSCQAIITLQPGAASGSYWLELPSSTIAEVYCDMTTDGGGWTLGFVRNTASTDSQGDFGAGEVSISAVSASPGATSSDKTAVMGWLDLNAMPWSDLQVAAYSDGWEAWRSTAISAASFRISFGEPGYLLYGEAGYYWCGGDVSYTVSGIGAVNNPAGATSNCNGHGSLGGGWDFSTSTTPNSGLTLCGSDGSGFLSTAWGGGWVYYGTPGGAQAIWVR